MFPLLGSCSNIWLSMRRTFVGVPNPSKHKSFVAKLQIVIIQTFSHWAFGNWTKARGWTHPCWLSDSQSFPYSKETSIKGITLKVRKVSGKSQEAYFWFKIRNGKSGIILNWEKVREKSEKFDVSWGRLGYKLYCPIAINIKTH